MHLSKKYPEIKITLFEVGNKAIKSESEIGYKSNILKDNYTGLDKGRFFWFWWGHRQSGEVSF